MTKKHFYWLLLGVIFWGTIPVLCIGIILDKNFYNIIESLSFFIFFTIMFTLIILGTDGTFPFSDPKKWFFAPLLCWLIFIVFDFLGISNIGEWIVSDVINEVFH